MSKKILLICSTLVLVSCANKSCNTSSNYETSDTNVSNTSENEEKSLYSKILEKFLNGCSIEGNYQIDDTKYTLSYMYIASNSAKKVIENTTDKFLVYDEKHFKGDNGYAYKEELSLNNEVSIIEEKFTFDSTYYNPFLLLNEFDFVKFNMEKAHAFFRSFFIDEIISLIDNVILNINDEELSSFNITGEKINGEFNVTYNDLKIEHLKPLEANKKQEELNNILKTYNKPLVVTIENVNDFTKNRTYYTGNSIYYQYDASKTEINEYDTWTNRIQGENYLLDLYYFEGKWEDAYNPQRYYEEEKLDLTKIGGVFFEYDEVNLKYKTSDYRLCELFVPKVYRNDYLDKDLLTDVYIKDNKIEKVEIYNNEKYFIITYDEYTSLPFSLVDEPIVL